MGLGLWPASLAAKNLRARALPPCGIPESAGGSPPGSFVCVPISV